MKNKEIIEKVLKETKKRWDSFDDKVWSVDRAVKFAIEKALSMKDNSPQTKPTKLDETNSGRLQSVRPVLCETKDKTADILKKIEEAIDSFRTPTYNFKHLDNLKEKIKKIFQEELNGK